MLIESGGGNGPMNPATCNARCQIRRGNRKMRMDEHHALRHPAGARFSCPSEKGRNYIMAKRLFTSESVTEGHPTKSATRSLTPSWTTFWPTTHRHVACETFTTTGIVTVMGEITTKHYTDIPSHRPPHGRSASATPIRLRLRLPLLRGDDRHRRAVPRHRHGRQPVL